MEFQQIMAKFQHKNKLLKKHKMSEFIKKNEGKKILNNETKDEKQDMKSNLDGVIVREKPNVTWDDVAGLVKAK